MTIRRRQIPFHLKGGTSYERRKACPWLAASVAETVTRYSSPGSYIMGSQVTDSESHQWPGRKVARLADIGGAFFTQKRYVEGNSFPSAYSANDAILSLPVCRDLRYEAPIWVCSPTLLSFPPAMNSSESTLRTVGAEAIARSSPTNSPADLSAFLGEMLRDGLPRFVPDSWAGRSSFARNAGSDYLNAEFGWKPLVDDVKSFALAIRDAGVIIRQYERDAGRVVRRRLEFPLNTTTTVTAGYGSGPYFMDPSFGPLIPTGGTSGITRVRNFEQRRWFSGAFTYFLPSGYDSRNALDSILSKADVLLGTSLTPELLWELTPWSWAADWFGNAGDVLSTVSAIQTDGLILRYGYMMEHTIVKDTFTRASPGKLQGQPVTPYLRFITETKQRVKASPFGFGVSWEGLSPRQLAIAAAVGITR